MLLTVIANFPKFEPVAQAAVTDLKLGQVNYLD